MINFTLGLLIGSAVFYVIFRIKRNSFLMLGSEIIHNAELEAQKKESALELKLKEREFEHAKNLQREEEKRLSKFEREKERLEKSEDKLELSLNLYEKRQSDLEKREKLFSIKEKEMEIEKAHLVSLKEKWIKEIEGLADLNSASAKELLFDRLEKELEIEFRELYIKRKLDFEMASEQEAKRILAATIPRLATFSTSELTSISISLPSEEMKGRVIGREGKNIRAFEELAGVNLIIDEAPKTIIISSFDPIRKAIAQMALNELVQDGRIHPSRIEEAIEKASTKIVDRIKMEGERSIRETKILPVHPELLQLLGKLYFRQSLGQNVLNHSIEVAHLMGLMASELGLESEMARRIGLLHDIGKAVSHEMEGSHALIGRDLALKYGEKAEIANGIGCHHGEIQPETIEASLCSAADAISASRPGARTDSAEPFIRRLQKLESIALRFEGVEKAYALVAGRELRVIVEPEKITDEALAKLAQKIAKAIAEEVTFAGKIRVTAIREKIATEYAT